MITIKATKIELVLMFYNCVLFTLHCQLYCASIAIANFKEVGGGGGGGGSGFYTVKTEACCVLCCVHNMLQFLQCRL